MTRWPTSLAQGGTELPQQAPLRVAVLAAVLSMAGLPLYIHLPQFASVELGVSLSVLGTVLLALRSLDFVQDPLLGVLADRRAGRQGSLLAGSAALLGFGFIALFAVDPPMSPALWLALTLACVFTGFSLLSILLYSACAALAGLAPARHVALVTWREVGTIFGIVVATTLPALLALWVDASLAFPLFAVMFASVLGLASVLFAPLLARTPNRAEEPRAASPVSFRQVLHAPLSRRLLMLAFLNALPVAVTSTTFLFFVDALLQLPDLSGGFLLLFFLSAGCAAPAWRHLSTRLGLRRTLISAMILAIVVFAGTAFLAPGQAAVFAAICVASGVVTGADMILLPALFSALVAQRGLPSGQAFGLWAFAGKASLALAAALALPVLDGFGFVPGSAENTPSALRALVFTYAILPCLLKLLALGLVLSLPALPDEPSR